ncbi:hypothetical protein EJ08DRAFT_581033 [Tothia fuscella]|uniref:Pru domain-containing protein n=1 Tax=Tothia fuscella TaxID=1048955 RepID=A0A9P4P1L4_9PEZI|nr:hypothetical protein EJ08DRAFT_581033 [Tothia fuscella]
MPITPLITFKAGECEASSDGGIRKIKCLPTPGYIFLYVDDEDLIHFCWRPRSKSVNDADLDLIMLPSDGSFKPYTSKDATPTSSGVTSPTNGRIFGLKFQSSSSRHFFWLQSKTQHPEGKENWFSERDIKIGEIVDTLLESGEPFDVHAELATVSQGPGRSDDGDQDENMEDAPPGDSLNRTNSTGGAGADATGGDVREEGHEAREGGADGGRAASSNLPTDANAAVQNFLRSLGGNNSQPTAQSSQSTRQDQLFTTLTDLLDPSTCISTLSTLTPTQIDTLLSNLPPQILLLAQESPDDFSENTSPTELSPESAQAAIDALSMTQKKDVLTTVFRSPQLHQSLGSLTMALRDGGLPMVAESLGIKVEGGGFVRGSGMPLGEGEAVKAFLEGVKRTVEEEEGEGGGEEGKMETD